MLAHRSSGAGGSSPSSFRRPKFHVRGRRTRPGGNTGALDTVAGLGGITWGGEISSRLSGAGASRMSVPEVRWLGGWASSRVNRDAGSTSLPLEPLFWAGSGGVTVIVGGVAGPGSRIEPDS